LTPINDPRLRIEWFHNGKSLCQGSRVKTINDFGFVILEIQQLMGRDAGEYLCKATNQHGECTTSCQLTIKGKLPQIVSTPQLPSHFKSGTESLQKLEENLWKREELEVNEEDKSPPTFISEMKDLEILEGQPGHFDCRVEPVNDVRIEWYLNGKPLAMGSRMHTSDDFGFVSLDLDWTFARDAGEYLCRAVNKYGFCTTRAKLIVKGKRDVLDSHIDAEKLSELERGPLRDDHLLPDLPSHPPQVCHTVG
jgi:hypothetical protein